MNKQKHKWSKTDDFVAFYLYKHGSKTDIELVALKLGIKVNSLKMRIKNYEFLANSKGLSNFSKQSKFTYDFWKDSNLNELTTEYKKIIP